MSNSSGFTMIECLVVLAISIILLCGSVFYNYSSWSYKSIADMMLHSFQFARLEALTRNQSVTLCGSENELECSENWAKGFIIFLPSDPIQIIRSYRFSYPIHIHSQQLKMIKFTREGRLLTRGSLWIEDRQGHKHYKIVFYDSGRARIETVS